MSKMIIMRGLPGSGKSYKAKEIQNQYLQAKWKTGADIIHLKCPILSTDKYFMAEAVYLFDRDELGHAHRWNQWRCNKLCEQRTSCIIDNTNTTWRECHPYIKIAIKHGYDIELQTPDTDWAWDVGECFQRNSHDVPRKVIQAMKERFESNDSIERKIRDAWKEADVS